MNKPLQDLDQIHADEATKQKTYAYVLAKQRSRSRHRYKKAGVRISIGMACACLFLLLYTAFPRSQPTSSSSLVPVATISMDINPSLEFELDENDNIIHIKTYNEDAKRIINTLDLQEKPIETGIQILMENVEFSQYLRDGILEIGVFANDDAVSQRLQTMINAYLNEQSQSVSYHCAVIDKQTHEEALQHNTSAGKYRVIEAIRAYTTDYQVADLNTKSMRELYTILQEYDPSAIPESCMDNSEQEAHGKQLRQHH